MSVVAKLEMFYSPNVRRKTLDHPLQVAGALICSLGISSDGDLLFHGPDHIPLMWLAAAAVAR